MGPVDKLLLLALAEVVLDDGEQCTITGSALQRMSSLTGLSEADVTTFLERLFDKDEFGNMSIGPYGGRWFDFPQAVAAVAQVTA